MTNGYRHFLRSGVAVTPRCGSKPQGSISETNKTSSLSFFLQGPPGKDGLPGHPGQRGETVSMAGVGTRGSGDEGWPGLSRSPTWGLRLLGPVGLGGSGRLGKGPGGPGRLPLTWSQPVCAQPRAGPQHPGSSGGRGRCRPPPRPGDCGPRSHLNHRGRQGTTCHGFFFLREIPVRATSHSDGKELGGLCGGRREGSHA